MKRILFLIFTSSLLLSAKYLSNKSCNECHEGIYDEYQTSYHSKSFLNDELHRKVANKVSTKKYDCASCHMPTANNLQNLIEGKARPDKNNVTHRDAVGCLFCHQITYVKNGHTKNKIILAKQYKGYKPTIYGSLEDPEESDKHTMTHSPIFRKYACTGCHSHKRNDNGVLIFDAMGKNDDSTECIKCHMPEVAGKVEDMDKKSRKVHHSHKFLGIHDKEFRKKSLDISLKVKHNTLILKLKNKMPHPLIIQASRLKYIKLTQKRGGKVIWQNFKNSPLEDKKTSFHIEFLDKHNKEMAIPAKAVKRGVVNNLGAKKSKIFNYKLPSVKHGDVIEASLYLLLVKPSCRGTLTFKSKTLTKPTLIKTTKLIVK